jgi:nicotinic acid mononucleotide adenylyltransferase
MEFLSRHRAKPDRLGILPGSFNPPTRAHLALAEASLAELDEVVLVLPLSFPHQSYDWRQFYPARGHAARGVASPPAIGRCR